MSLLRFYRRNDLLEEISTTEIRAVETEANGPIRAHYHSLTHEKVTETLNQGRWQITFAGLVCPIKILIDYHVSLARAHPAIYPEGERASSVAPLD